MDAVSIVYGVVLLLVSISFTIIGYLIKEKVKDMEKDVAELRDDVKKIKGNYLNRFDDIKDRMNKQHEEMLKEITKLTIAVGKQTAYCSLVQDMKKR